MVPYKYVSGQLRTYRPTDKYNFSLFTTTPKSFTASTILRYSDPFLVIFIRFQRRKSVSISWLFIQVWITHFTILSLHLRLLETMHATMAFYQVYMPLSLVLATIVAGVPLNTTLGLVAQGNHGPPYCKPTGSGVCNLAFYSRYYFDTRHLVNEVFIYNNYCHQNGWASVSNPRLTWALYSKLPNPVFYTFNDRWFKYNGREYAKTWGNCITYQDLNETPRLGPGMITQCAFDCENVVRAAEIETRGIEAPIETPLQQEIESRSNFNTTLGLVPRSNHGPPYCNPTGPGVCNFAFYYREYFDPPHHIAYEVFAYNRYCTLIGHDSVASSVLQQMLYSKLPHPIFYVHDSHWFRYGAREYSWAWGNCIKYFDTNGLETPGRPGIGFIYQCAFDCEDVGREGEVEGRGIEGRGENVDKAV